MPLPASSHATVPSGIVVRFLDDLVSNVSDVQTHPKAARRLVKPTSPAMPILAPIRISPLLTKMLGGTVLLAAAAGTARADVTVVSPPTVVPASLPMRVTLLFAEDTENRANPTNGARRNSVRYTVPSTLKVALTSGDLPPQTLTLTRDPKAPEFLSLRPGQFRRISYSAPWPTDARGTVRVQVADFNASPALVTLDRGKQQNLTIAANQAASAIGPGAAEGSERAHGAEHGPAATLPNATPGTAASPTTTTATGAVPASDASIGQQQAAIAATNPESRLSFYEPMYIGVGRNGHTTARFQFSFKYRIVKPADPRSRSLVDNLYFGYTQVSIWDLSANSKPFRDTSYKPSIFYYLPDTGLRGRWFDSLGFQAGLRTRIERPGRQRLAQHQHCLRAADRSFLDAVVDPVDVGAEDLLLPAEERKLGHREVPRLHRLPDPVRPSGRAGIVHDAAQGQSW